MSLGGQTGFRAVWVTGVGGALPERVTSAHCCRGHQRKSAQAERTGYSRFGAGTQVKGGGKGSGGHSGGWVKKNHQQGVRWIQGDRE